MFRPELSWRPPVFRDYKGYWGWRTSYDAKDQSLALLCKSYAPREIVPRYLVLFYFVPSTYQEHMLGNCDFRVWGRNLYIFKIFWNLFKRQVLYKQLVMDIRKGILCRVSQISSIHHKEIFLDLFLKERLWAAPGYSLLALSLRLIPHSWQAFGNYR